MKKMELKEEERHQQPLVIPMPKPQIDTPEPPSDAKDHIQETDALGFFISIWMTPVVHANERHMFRPPSIPRWKITSKWEAMPVKTDSQK